MYSVEPLESRCLLSEVVEASAKLAAAYEQEAIVRFFYIRRGSDDLSQSLSVFYTVGGKAKQGLDYHPIGDGITIQAGRWLRRIEVTPIDDGLDEVNESVTLTLNTSPTYSIRADKPAATIRIISSEDTPTPPVSQPTMITWTSRTASPIARAEALRAVIDGKLYVLGGFSGDDGPVKRSDAYDPGADQWTQIADLPTRLTHAGVSSDGRDIYVAGGYIGIGATGYNQQFGTRDVWKYNVDSNQWTAMPPLPVALAGGGSAVIGRKLHYFGGNDANRVDTGVHYALDLDNPSSGWQSLDSLPDPRSHFASAVVNNRIYVAGGQHGNDDQLTTVVSVHSYDPATGAWTALASMPVAVSHIASASVALNGRMYVAGGETDHEAPTSQARAYDIATNTWHSLTPLPVARFSGVLGAIGGVLYFTGGSSQTTTWKGVLS